MSPTLTNAARLALSAGYLLPLMATTTRAWEIGFFRAPTCTTKWNPDQFGGHGKAGESGDCRSNSWSASPQTLMVLEWDDNCHIEFWEDLNWGCGDYALAPAEPSYVLKKGDVNYDKGNNRACFNKLPGKIGLDEYSWFRYVCE